jgi:hypothetical protein
VLSGVADAFSYLVSHEVSAGDNGGERPDTGLLVLVSEGCEKVGARSGRELREGGSDLVEGVAAGRQRSLQPLSIVGQLAWCRPCAAGGDQRRGDGERSAELGLSQRSSRRLVKAGYGYVHLGTCC